MYVSETDAYSSNQFICPSSWTAFSESVPHLKSVTSINVPQLNITTTEEQYFDGYFGAGGCGCERHCHTRFSKSAAFEAHIDALNLDRYCSQHVNHQHMLLLGAMNALITDNSVALADNDATKGKFLLPYLSHFNVNIFIYFQIRQQ